MNSSAGNEVLANDHGTGTRETRDNVIKTSSSHVTVEPDSPGGNVAADAVQLRRARPAYDLPIGNQHPDKRQSRRNSTMRLLRWLHSWPGDSWQARWETSAAELQGKNWREPGIDELLAAEEMSRFAARRHFTVGMSCLISLQVLRPGYDWLIPTTSPTPTGTCGRWSRRSSSPGRMPGPSETASANASASTRSTTSAAS